MSSDVTITFDTDRDSFRARCRDLEAWLLKNPDRPPVPYYGRETQMLRPLERPRDPFSECMGTLWEWMEWVLHGA